MQLRFGLTLALSALSLAGCSSLGIKNGSLDYKDTTSVETLKYPEGTTVRPATPLYPAPVIDPLALQHAPKFENKRGNRYDVPRPEVTQTTTLQQSQTDASVTTGHPQLLTDGNANPLLKVDGDSAIIWQYALATLSSLNYKVVGESKNATEVTFKLNDKTYILKLSSVGSSNTIALFNADNTFADKEIAAEVLTQIYQNWPA
ncbi:MULTISPECIES: lipoprotein-34 precursor (NlpB) [Acinetobacter]|uniref:Lipoprotein-34 (NlpB) n=1 Tax=Acinetobacter piscicola TaxID=2006115 RepID=A0A4Q4GRW2_9GAMM|nr:MULTISPECIES: lipoprotein-34 precursor (NlpB) [Acinetobacter]QOW47724.1 lipoprotein-34 precursor (NlpB) [Acinetobacter piscicola]RYL22715.1 lipoprotein-34 precursor (NlpB) [Acinetobacter piscicola]